MAILLKFSSPLLFLTAHRAATGRSPAPHPLATGSQPAQKLEASNASAADGENSPRWIRPRKSSATAGNAPASPARTGKVIETVFRPCHELGEKTPNSFRFLA